MFINETSTEKPVRRWVGTEGTESVPPEQVDENDC